MESTPSENRIMSCLIETIHDHQQDPLVKEKIIDRFTDIIQNTIYRETQNMEHIKEKCIICWKNKINHIFIPCGHYIMCEECVIKISKIPLISLKCPICRTYGSYYKVYNCHQQSEHKSEISTYENQNTEE
jgi:glutamate racemase